MTYRIDDLIVVKPTSRRRTVSNVLGREGKVIECRGGGWYSIEIGENAYTVRSSDLVRADEYNPTTPVRLPSRIRMNNPNIRFRQFSELHTLRINVSPTHIQSPPYVQSPPYIQSPPSLESDSIPDLEPIELNFSYEVELTPRVHIRVCDLLEHSYNTNSINELVELHRKIAKLSIQSVSTNIKQIVESSLRCVEERIDEEYAKIKREMEETMDLLKTKPIAECTICAERDGAPMSCCATKETSNVICGECVSKCGSVCPFCRTSMMN